jgi:hypothetical protein
VLHEAGHLAAALMNDFEVGAVTIGPFRMARFGGSWTLILNLLSQNDAALLRSLWGNHSRAGELFLYHLILQQQRAGVRPRDYLLGLIRLLACFEGRTDFNAFFATTIASLAYELVHQQHDGGK